MGARALQNGSAERGERARIGHDARLDALYDTVLVTAHGEVHLERVTLGVDEDRFAPAELDLDGHPRDISDQSGMMLYGHIFFTAEASADELILHQTVIIVHAEHLSALMERGVGALVGGQQLDTAVIQRDRYTALRLQESVLSPRGLEMMRQNILGSLYCVFGVAA